MLFKGLEEKDARAIKQKLGDYVSHKVVHPRGRELESVDTLNALDRRLLAEEWFWQTEDWFSMWLINIIRGYYKDIDEFLNEAALFIDDRIPRAYMKHYEQNHDQGPAWYNPATDRDGKLPYGLVHCLKQTSTHYHKALEEPATKSQLWFLGNLAKKNKCDFLPVYITKSAADRCIKYFLGEGNEPDETIFQKHFKKKIT